MKVPCTEPHDWRAVTTIKLGEPERPLPRRPAVRGATRDFCSKSVGAWLDYPVDYDFGYTWFHEPEWDAGNRRSVCWAKTDPVTRRRRARCRRCSPAGPARCRLLGRTTVPSRPDAGLDERVVGHRRPRRPRRRRPTGRAAARRPAPATASRTPTRVAPHERREPVPLRPSDHTAITFYVGDLDTVVDGHLVAVDSDRVQAQVADRVPAGASRRSSAAPSEARRLSMLRPVWFTPEPSSSPTPAPTGTAATRSPWPATSSSPPLTGASQGVLGTTAGRATATAMCGTAEPGTAGFERVICSATPRVAGAAHRRRRRAGATPASTQVREAGQQTCQDAARAVADDPLNYRWGYEWPTEQQWQAGQHYGHLLGARAWTRLTGVGRSAQNPSLRSCRGSRCQSLAILTCRSR